MDNYYYDDPVISSIENKHTLEALNIELLLQDIQTLVKQWNYIQRVYDFGKRQSAIGEENFIQQVDYVIIEGLHSFIVEPKMPQYWCKIYIDRPIEYALIDRMRRDYDAFHPEKKLKPIEIYLDDIQKNLLPTMRDVASVWIDLYDIRIDTMLDIITERRPNYPQIFIENLKRACHRNKRE